MENQKQLLMLSIIKRFFKILFMISGILFLLLAAWYFYPQAHTFMFGESIEQRVIQDLNSRNEKTDEERIFHWEQENIIIPYGKTKNVLGTIWFEYNGTYRPFIPGPPQWTMATKTGNCLQIAEVTVLLLNKTNHTARIVHAPGEDHVFTEYLLNGTSRVIDAGFGKITSDLRNYSTNTGWSYLETHSYNNPEETEEVTKNYLDTKQLSVNVKDKKGAITNAEVTILSPHLSTVAAETYSEPILVTRKKTNEKGTATFNLAPHDYRVIITVRKILFFKDTAIRDLSLANESAILVELS